MYVLILNLTFYSVMHSYSVLFSYSVFLMLLHNLIHTIYSYPVTCFYPCMLLQILKFHDMLVINQI